MNLAELHRAAREIFKEALRRVDAGRAVRRAVQIEDAHLKILETTFSPEDLSPGIYSIAIGKAARPMASALNEILGERLKACVIAAQGEGMKNDARTLGRADAERKEEPMRFLFSPRLRASASPCMDARRFLDESDAYTFFRQLNDEIVTGPTGTNVRDLRIMLAS